MKNGEMECLKYVIDALDKHNNGEIVFTNIESNNTLLQSLKEVKPNPNENKFPDFVSNGIIVEHFSITAGKENRNGSIYRKEESIKNKETERKIEEWKDDFIKLQFENNTIKTNYIENIYTNFSHLNFINSLNRILIKHINSLKKYNANSKKIIFLIEQKDAVLKIFRNGTFYEFYKISEDKKALDLLKPYKELISIIIFRALDRIEIIDMTKFDDIYKDSNSEEDIRGGRLKDIRSLIKLDINF